MSEGGEERFGHGRITTNKRKPRTEGLAQTCRAVLRCRTGQSRFEVMTEDHALLGWECPTVFGEALRAIKFTPRLLCGPAHSCVARHTNRGAVILNCCRLGNQFLSAFFTCKRIVHGDEALRGIARNKKLHALCSPVWHGDPCRLCKISEG